MVGKSFRYHKVLGTMKPIEHGCRWFFFLQTLPDKVLGE